MKNYTICLVGQALCSTIVIGGGDVAARKIRGLLAAGAHITVISPKLTPELQTLADTGKILFLQRCYQEGDLEHASLVIAATSDIETNHTVWREAQRRGCLVNVVDDPQHSNFIMPAVLHRGDMSIAVSTGGSSPALARRLRDIIGNLIGLEYGLLSEVLGELRPELIAGFPAGGARLQAVLRVLDSDILNIIRTQGKAAALTYGREKMHQE